MRFSVSLLPAALLLFAGLILSGCQPLGQGQVDEQKDAHFLAGMSHVNTLDYPAAIESFEKALAVNPKSASAHFQLGLLFYQKVPDPAAAIYHYEHYLKLRPNAENAEWVKQHIQACKRELARTVSLGPISDKQQRDLEKLVEDNKKLADENKRLNDEVAKWRSFYNAQMREPTNPPVRPLPVPSPQPGPTSSLARPGSTTPPPQSTTAGNTLKPLTPTNPPPVTASQSRTAPATRTHTVRAHETLAAIAREHGIRVEALTAANPGLNPRRLRPGQTLNIP